MLLCVLVNASMISVKIHENSKGVASSEGPQWLGTEEARRLAFHVHPSSLFEFGTMFMDYLAKTLSNVTKEKNPEQKEST